MPNDPSVSLSRSDTTEQTIATLWKEILQTPDTPVGTDDFFALGGDSLSMVLLEYRIQEELFIELPAGSVLGAPTLGELARMIDAQRCALRMPEDTSTEGIG